MQAPQTRLTGPSSGVVPVRCRVMFRGFFRMVFRLYMMAVRQMCVVAGLFMFTRFVVLRGSYVVGRSLLMMFRCLTMMIGAFFRHGILTFGNSGTG